MSLKTEILPKDDSLWPTSDRVRRQELEIVMGDEHISFSTSKIGSLFLCQSIKVRNTLHGFETMKLFNVFILLLHMDADGLRAFYYLVQDSKCICVLSHWSPLQHQTHLF